MGPGPAFAGPFLITIGDKKLKEISGKSRKRNSKWVAEKYYK